MPLIKCTDCGRMISDRAKACPNCGALVKKTILCEDCGNAIPVGAVECPSCGCPVAPPAPSVNQQNLPNNYQAPQENHVYDYYPEEKPNHNKLLYWILGAAAALILAAGAGLLYYLYGTRGSVQEDDYSFVDTTAVEEQGMTEEEMQQAYIDQVTTWQYGQMEDDLTHKGTAYTATIYSTNECQYDSHGNKTRMIMQLIYSSLYLSEPSTAVFFMFDDGEGDLCRYADDFSSGIRVVFDDGDVDTRWSLIQQTSKQNAVFMFMPNKVKPFLAELRSSKTCRIQVNLEHVGMTTFDFNIQGLKWDYDKDNTTSRASQSKDEPGAAVDAARDAVTDAAEAAADAAADDAESAKF